MSASKGLMQAAAGVETGNPWDISEAVFSQSFSVASQEGNPAGLFFKPDGTRMYTCGIGSAVVYEYSLSTAWDVSSASFSRSKDISATHDNTAGLFFRSDGRRMYVADFGDNAIKEYNLSTAWNINTASFSREENVNTQEANVQSVSFKPDGTRMYIIGSTGVEVNEFSLSSAWNVTTASHVRSLSVSSKESTPRALYFRTDGAKMYICGSGSTDVHEYDLSTAWNISSASFLQSFDVGAQDTNPREIHFKDDDGLKMYFVGMTNDAVYEYDL